MSKCNIVGNHMSRLNYLEIAQIKWALSRENPSSVFARSQYVSSFDVFATRLG